MLISLDAFFAFFYTNLKLESIKIAKKKLI